MNAAAGSNGGGQTAPSMTGPLLGVRVIVLDGKGPTPFATMLLADMGANVLRIARPANHAARALPQSDAMPTEHDVTNRGVETVTLDLKSKVGQSVAVDLIGHSDAFVEGFRPGVVERLGLGPEILLARNPSLVYARLTGYGQTGPLAQQAGHDINYLAQSGVLHGLRREGQAPHPPINLLADYAGGGTFAAFGIVCALFEARSSGRGQVIDAVMLDGAALLSARIQGLRAAGLFDGAPGTNYLDGGAPFYGTYECADGRYVAVGALEPDFYAAFIARLGAEVDMWPDQQDASKWPQLRELIASAFSARTRDEWAEVFRGSDCCVSPVLDFDEAARDTHNVERALYTDICGALHPAPAPRFSRTPARPVSRPLGPDDYHDVVGRWLTETNGRPHAGAVNPTLERTADGQPL